MILSLVERAHFGENADSEDGHHQEASHASCNAGGSCKSDENCGFGDYV